MALIRVYLWKPGNGNVGHASLALKTGEMTERYLSFWPKGTGDDDVKGADSSDLIFRTSYDGNFKESVGDDIAAEGKFHDEVIDIRSFSRPLLQSYINKIKSNPPSYQMWSVNCSYVVAKALYAATGIKKNFSLHGGHQLPISKYGHLCRGIWTPMMVKKYADQLKKREMNAGEVAAAA